jgi:hypothetical protein
MGRTVKGKTTEADHLAQVAKQLGKSLDDVEQANSAALFPDIASYVWATFLSLHDGRTYGMSGPNPISYDIIKAWCDLYGVALNPWEIDTVKALDNLWIKITSEENG